MILFELLKNFSQNQKNSLNKKSTKDEVTKFSSLEIFKGQKCHEIKNKFLSSLKTMTKSLKKGLEFSTRKYPENPEKDF